MNGDILSTTTAVCRREPATRTQEACPFDHGRAGQRSAFFPSWKAWAGVSCYPEFLDTGPSDATGGRTGCVPTRMVGGPSTSKTIGDRSKISINPVVATGTAKTAGRGDQCGTSRLVSRFASFYSWRKAWAGTFLGSLGNVDAFRADSSEDPLYRPRGRPICSRQPSFLTWRKRTAFLLNLFGLGASAPTTTGRKISQSVIRSRPGKQPTLRIKKSIMADPIFLATPTVSALPDAKDAPGRGYCHTRQSTLRDTFKLFLGYLEGLAAGVSKTTGKRDIRGVAGLVGGSAAPGKKCHHAGRDGVAADHYPTADKNLGTAGDRFSSGQSTLRDSVKELFKHHSDVGSSAGEADILETVFKLRGPVGLLGSFNLFPNFYGKGKGYEFHSQIKKSLIQGVFKGP